MTNTKLSAVLQLVAPDSGPKIILQNKSICFHVKFSSPLNFVDVDCGVTKEARQGDGSDLGQEQ